MSPLDWHIHSRLRQGLKWSDDESKIFRDFSVKSTTLLVESQAECELVGALKLIYGGNPQVFLLDQGKDWMGYLDRFPRVFTTWDPFDINRI